MTYLNLPLRRVTHCVLLALATASSMSQPVWAETDAVTDNPAAQATPNQATQNIERIQVTGRLLSSAAVTAAERRDQAQVSEFLDAEMISRIGDSDVGAALKRVTGLTLVDNKFIYVRGLGERYSSTLLNGAMVPSPDPTRNVVPLDMFPTGIIDSLMVLKSYAVDQPATFGGGGVNIRTLSLPRERVFEVSLGTGFNSLNNDDGLTYAGGSDDWRGRDDGTRALAPEIQQALATYGSLDTIAIARQLGPLNADTLQHASTINRELGSAFNRNMDIDTKSIGPDMDASITYGDRIQLNDQWTLGAVASVAYDRGSRNIEEQERYYSITQGDELTPLVRYDDISGTQYSTQISSIISAGINYANAHRVEASHIYLLDTADEVKLKVGDTIETINEQNRENMDYSVRYEERTMVANQLRGHHSFEQLWDLGIDWQWTDARARRYAPGEVDYRYVRNTDSAGQTSAALRRSDNAVQYVFADMQDQTENGSIDARLPIDTRQWQIELQGGYNYFERARESEVDRFKFDSRGFSNLELQQSFRDIFATDNILDPTKNFAISDITAQADDYVAAQQLDASYFGLDALYNDTWRFVIGARYEDFRQIALPLSPATGQIEGNPAEFALLDDDWYPSAAVTWLFHPDMQLRLGASQTVVRPDLREVTPVLYVDPVTDFSVIGHAGLASSKLDNLDVRWEWYTPTGNSLSVGAFYKDIDAPIETVEILGSDGNLLVSFRNAEQGRLYGLETEFVYQLAGLWQQAPTWLEQFFVAGNLTLSDSDIRIQALGESNLTHQTRRMSGHSKYVVNSQLGFDSLNQKHSATLSYNVFGARINFAGVNGKDDAFEQPFHSLDATYSYYPTEGLTLSLKATNLLGERTEILQQGEILQARDPGTELSASVSYKF